MPYYTPSAKLLVALFVFWKALLLFIVYLNPNDGYDSSTHIFLLPEPSGHLSPSRANLSTRLLRWDAIYFAAAAHRGYVHEQEWAFSWAYTSVLHQATATTRMSTQSCVSF
jgi:GPI mannosyltransferase 2